MSSDRELTRIVSSWLEEGANVLPDRVLDDVLARLPVTPQRRPWWRAWRNQSMNRTLMAVGGTVAVLVVAVALGVYFSRPAVGPVGSPTPSSSPTTAVATSTPTQPAISPTPSQTQTAASNAPFIVFGLSDHIFSTPDDLWAMRADGTGGQEINHASDSSDFFVLYNFAWSPDGKKFLLVSEDSVGVAHVHIAQVSDTIGPFVDTGFSTGADTACNDKSTEPHPCQDSNFTFAPGGQRVAFIQSCTYNPQPGCGFVTILDLRTGELTELSATLQQGGHKGPMSGLAWSPDGTQIAYIIEGDQRVFGEGGVPDSNLWLINADGTNLHMVDLAVPRVTAPQWSPDGKTLALTSDLYVDGPEPGSQTLVVDVYTVRPDGTDLRQLTTDGLSSWPEWVNSDRIRFRRGTVSGPTMRYSLMDADGSNVTELVDLDGLIKAFAPEGMGPRVPGDLGPTFFWQPGSSWYEDR
jgi:Tol biopolymer transport system component